MRALAPTMIVAAGIGLSNCAAPSPPVGNVNVSHPVGDGTCEAGPAQTFIGREARQALASPILDASGSRQLRWAGPNTILTMEYLAWRVTVSYDADGIIEQIDCG